MNKLSWWLACSVKFKPGEHNPQMSKIRSGYFKVEHSLSSWMHDVRDCCIIVNSKVVCKKVKRIAEKKMEELLGCLNVGATD